jgi:hypothetical protein
MSSTAAGILGAFMLFSAMAVSLSLEHKTQEAPPLIQAMGEGRVIIFYLNTMVLCDASGCKKIGHMFQLGSANSQ